MCCSKILVQIRVRERKSGFSQATLFCFLYYLTFPIIEMQSPSSLPDPSNFPNDVQIGDGKHSYKDIASNNLPTIEFSMEPLPSEEENDNLDNDLISLSIEDKKYLYAP